MNELIEKLSNQAIEGMPGAWNIPDEFCENFAELIVRECALVAFKKAGPKTALDVLEHFGVE